MAKMLSNFVRFLCKKHGFAQLNKVNFEPNTTFFRCQTKTTNKKVQLRCFYFSCLIWLAVATELARLEDCVGGLVVDEVEEGMGGVEGQID